ncbi:MAG: hypothetical protein NTV72_02230 [Candidatus Taylorbacteria bacterium]|nr:hypothetical protein [Candidatus Taylorbacteria bacterium]
MRPMSIKKRRTFIVIFFALFIILIPIVILYSLGYRPGGGFFLVKTGGLYVHAPTSGVTFTMSNGNKENLGLFQNGFFVQNLIPNDYAVSLSKEGYYPWAKILRVKPQLVSEAFPILIPRDLKLTEIEKTLGVATTSSIKATTSKVDNSEYKRVSGLFALATTTANLPLQKIKNKVEIFAKGDNIFALWNGDYSDIPLSFCTYDICEATSTVFEAPGLKYIDFYPNRNDVILITSVNGIVVVEMDKRPLQNIFPYYPVRGSEFRVDTDGIIYVKDGDRIFIAGV